MNLPLIKQIMTRLVTKSHCSMRPIAVQGTLRVSLARPMLPNRSKTEIGHSLHNACVIFWIAFELGWDRSMIIPCLFLLKNSASSKAWASKSRYGPHVFFSSIAADVLRGGLELLKPLIVLSEHSVCLYIYIQNYHVYISFSIHCTY